MIPHKFTLIYPFLEVSAIACIAELYTQHKLTDCLGILESQEFCGSSALLVLGMVSISDQGEVDA